MTYLTVKQAAERHSVTPRRIVALAADDRIPGAKKFGSVWMIPDGFVVLPPPKRNRKLAKIKA